MASLVLLLAACSVKPAPESSSDQTTSSSGSAEQTASETSADQTAAELKAEVSVASQNETEAPAEAQKEISGERSDPGDIYDATGFVSVTDVVPDVILIRRAR